MNCPSAPHTHSLEDVCILIGCESEDWLIERVRNGTFPARRIVRALRFSDDDIAKIIETSVANTRQAAAVIEPPRPTRMIKRAS